MIDVMISMGFNMTKTQILKNSFWQAFRMNRFLDGQASLELTAALIIVAILLIASVKMFVWFNARMVMRQVAYESSRVTAGSVPHEDIDIYSYEGTKGVQVDDSGYEALNLF